MKAVLFIGQSNQLGVLGSTVTTAASGTYVWDNTNGGWITPTNDGIVAYANELKSLTGQNVYVLDCAVGGTSLLDFGPSVTNHERNWTNKVDSTSPLKRCLDILTAAMAAGADVSIVDFTQGEDESNFGVSMEAYLGGLIELQGIICQKLGKRPENLPFFVSPVGNAVKVYNYGRTVDAAQRFAPQYAGFKSGAEYHDLSVDSTNIHLDSTGRTTFAQRKARIHAGLFPVSQSSGSSSVNAKVVTFDWDVSTTGNQTVSGVGFTPKAVVVLSAFSSYGDRVSIGISDGASHGNVHGNAEGTRGVFGATASAVRMVSDASNKASAALAGFHSDGFYLSKSVDAGTPTGTVACKALCIG